MCGILVLKTPNLMTLREKSLEWLSIWPSKSDIIICSCFVSWNSLANFCTFFAFFLQNVFFYSQKVLLRQYSNKEIANTWICMYNDERCILYSRNISGERERERKIRKYHRYERRQNCAQCYETCNNNNDREKRGLFSKKKTLFFLSNGIGRFEGDKKKQLAQ